MKLLPMKPAPPVTSMDMGVKVAGVAHAGDMLGEGKNEEKQHGFLKSVCAAVGCLGVENELTT